MEPQYNMNDFTGKMTEVTTTVKNYPWYNGWKHDNAGQLVYDENGDKIPIDENWYNTATYVDANGDTVRWWDDGDPMEIIVEVDGPDGKPDNPGTSMEPTDKSSGTATTNKDFQGRIPSSGN